jgi:hypothetical protein
MANSNTPRGFYPISDNCRTTLYKCNTSENIFRGDPVVLGNDGLVTVQSDTEGAVYMAGIVLGFVDSDRAGLGAAMEAYPYYKQLTENIFAVVCDDPNQRYVVQSHTGQNLSLTSVGQTIMHGYLQGSGSTITGVSHAEILGATTAVIAASGLFRIVDILDAVDNTTGNWAKWIVKPNRIQSPPTTVGQIV